MTVSDIAVKNWINCPHVSLNVRKRNFEHMRPAKIQIRLRECTVWDPKVAMFLHVDNKDADQTARMRRVI